MGEVLVQQVSDVEGHEAWQDMEEESAEQLSFPKLDGVIFPLVEANADVVAPCQWMNGAEVSLSTALINYPKIMTEENADEVLANIHEFLANQVQANVTTDEALTEDTEEAEVELPSFLQNKEDNSHEAVKQTIKTPKVKEEVKLEASVEQATPIVKEVYAEELEVVPVVKEESPAPVAFVASDNSAVKSEPKPAVVEKRLPEQAVSVVKEELQKSTVPGDVLSEQVEMVADKVERPEPSVKLEVPKEVPVKVHVAKTVDKASLRPASVTEDREATAVPEGRVGVDQEAPIKQTTKETPVILASPNTYAEIVSQESKVVEGVAESVPVEVKVTQTSSSAQEVIDYADDTIHTPEASYIAEPKGELSVPVTQESLSEVSFDELEVALEVELESEAEVDLEPMPELAVDVEAVELDVLDEVGSGEDLAVEDGYLDIVGGSIGDEVMIDISQDFEQSDVDNSDTLDESLPPEEDLGLVESLDSVDLSLEQPDMGDSVLDEVEESAIDDTVELNDDLLEMPRRVDEPEYVPVEEYELVVEREEVGSDPTSNLPTDQDVELAEDAEGVELTDEVAEFDFDSAYSIELNQAEPTDKDELPSRPMSFILEQQIEGEDYPEDDDSTLYRQTRSVASAVRKTFVKIVAMGRSALRSYSQ